MTLIDALDLHRNTMIVDAVAPLLREKSYLDWYVQGGVTAVAPTVAIYEDAGQALREIGSWLAHIRRNPNLVLVRGAGDILRAKTSGQLGVILHFQGSDPIENHLDLLDAYRALGVGVIQLAYNVRNRICDGAEETEDAGLSRFGRDFVRRCNEVGIIVDCSHTGERSSLEAMAMSTSPVVFSHANARAVHDSRRNITDDQIRAAAATGGLIGVAGFPGFVSASSSPTLDQLIDHVDHVVRLVGAAHVGLGLDYYPGQHGVADERSARRNYEAALASGKWQAQTYPAPPHRYPEGIETPRTLPAFTARLLQRGYSAEEVKLILGGNWLRVYESVWGNKYE